ncbi:MAG: hypothetical protein AAGF10_06525 [Verrucomicrobiota bacterium]
MAKANLKLINALRQTADKLDNGGDYHWAHAGKCNCGHLAQVVTGLGAKDIFLRARASELTEWTEYANDYCPTSGQPVDELIDSLLEIGLERRDLHHLEYLSDVKVLMAVPGGMRYLRRNQPADVALYLRTWAGMLEVQWKEARQADAVKARPRKTKQSAPAYYLM